MFKVDIDGHQLTIHYLMTINIIDAKVFVYLVLTKSPIHLYINARRDNVADTRASGLAILVWTWMFFFTLYVVKYMKGTNNLSITKTDLCDCICLLERKKLNFISYVL